MDQDFHYYGTYYAARVGGNFDAAEATLIAKSSNFIDFLSETNYSGYWKLARRNPNARTPDDHAYVGEVNNPRYTFQGGLTGSLVSPEDGLWCSYHFTPGNYPDPEGTPSPTKVHGADVARALPAPSQQGPRLHHDLRDMKRGITGHLRWLLNRPQSPLSRTLLTDTIRCVTDPARLERILRRAAGSCELLPEDNAVRTRNIHRFGLILLGARAHVIADTWAHQDFSGISHEMNTYYDVNGSGWGRQSIDYQDVGNEWKNVVLSSMSHDNFKAVPSGTSYLGHGWMGHFPDYSFVKFRYRPAWREASAEPIVRNNPEQYRHAWLELASLFARVKGNHFLPQGNARYLQAAAAAIDHPTLLSDHNQCPRHVSSLAWMQHLGAEGITNPADVIDARQEPDPGTVLPGVLHASDSSTRYGTFVVDASSDIYMFQVAADYHFHFVKHYLHRHEILDFGGTWSAKPAALAATIDDLF